MTEFKLMGTPTICPNCGDEDKIRLFRGTRLKNCFCVKCGHKGLKRNTDWDKREQP